MKKKMLLFIYAVLLISIYSSKVETAEYWVSSADELEPVSKKLKMILLK